MKYGITAFNFTSKEIKENLKDAVSWHRFVREHEFESLMNVLKGPFDNALELGAGNGEQSEVIAKYCKHLTCTELEEDGGNLIIGKFKSLNLENVTYELCDATDLSKFPNETFDFIYSSNMVEHIPDWSKCFSECKRVLTEDGLMVHAMPSRDWKFWNSIHYFLKRKKPMVHGIETTNIEEFKVFGEKSWINRIEYCNLQVNGLVRMPFYFGAGTRYKSILILGNLLKWKSSTAYIMTKR